MYLITWKKDSEQFRMSAKTHQFDYTGFFIPSYQQSVIFNMTFHITFIVAGQ